MENTIIISFYRQVAENMTNLTEVALVLGALPRLSRTCSELEKLATVRQDTWILYQPIITRGVISYAIN